MATTVRIQANIHWGVTPAKGGNWVAVCEPLKLTVQSETWTELMEDIGYTLDSVLRDLLGSNELPGFLKEHGWQLAGAIPVQARPEDIRFDVPFFAAMMNQQNGTPRHVYQ